MIHLVLTLSIDARGFELSLTHTRFRTGFLLIYTFKGNQSVNSLTHTMIQDKILPNVSFTGN